MAELTPTQDREELREEVRRRYAAAAKDAGGCCSPSLLPEGEPAVFGRSQYSDAEQAELPDTAALASLGCGNPTAVAELHAGETVLDLGSGGGIDVLLSARRVGAAGEAYRLDMTDEMVELARRKQREGGGGNAEVGKGTDEGGAPSARSI